jgi:hypothetical protein
MYICLNLQKILYISAYVIFLAIIVSLIGVIVEPVMISGITQLNPAYVRAWFVMTVFCFLFSVVLAMCFILHNASLIRIGDNWFNDALCVLADVVFFFIPEYLLGPRLIPLLIVILILAHILLPVFHGCSFMVVYSYYRLAICPSAEALAAARAGNTHSSAPIVHYDEEYNNGGIKPGGGGHHRLCQKCHLASQEVGENGGMTVIDGRCTSTPLLKPIETTC